jgi:hypothetical protein
VYTRTRGTAPNGRGWLSALRSRAGCCSCSAPAAAAGLYGSLPVSWSDPFMMRRLLWHLLGKLNPTAQA